MGTPLTSASLHDLYITTDVHAADSISVSTAVAAELPTIAELPLIAELVDADELLPAPIVGELVDDSAVLSATVLPAEVLPSTSVGPNLALVSLSPGVVKILNNRFMVFGIMALIGPLGLPALWFSQRFSRTMKIVITVLFILVTIILPLVVSWYLLDINLRPLVEAMNRVNQGK